MNCKRCGRSLPTVLEARITGIAPDEPDYPEDSTYYNVLLEIACPSCGHTDTARAKTGPWHILELVYDFTGEFKYRAPRVRNTDDRWTWEIDHEDIIIRFGIRDDDVLRRAMAEENANMVEYILSTVPIRSTETKLAIVRRWIDVMRPHWYLASDVKCVLHKLRSKMPDIATEFEDELSDLANHVHYDVYVYPDMFLSPDVFGPFQSKQDAAEFVKQSIAALNGAVIYGVEVDTTIVRMRGTLAERKYVIKASEVLPN